ncbi:hypothetical protein OF83DRAFT_1178288 [Amylostereum chailletii]|nr:hypothetical protein OF83DRAFT_1178288 [Amylostereum chailletii]
MSLAIPTSHPRLPPPWVLGPFFRGQDTNPASLMLASLLEDPDASPTPSGSLDSSSSSSCQDPCSNWSVASPMAENYVYPSSSKLYLAHGADGLFTDYLPLLLRSPSSASGHPLFTVGLVTLEFTSHNVNNQAIPTGLSHGFVTLPPVCVAHSSPYKSTRKHNTLQQLHRHPPESRTAQQIGCRGPRAQQVRTRQGGRHP